MRVTSLVLAGMAATTTGAWFTGTGAPVPLASSLGAVVLAQDSARHDAAIRRAFRDAFNREPTARELRRYRALMEANDWTEADLRRDLRERTDYQRYSSQGGSRPEVAIRRAYQDILGRDPDAEGLLHYRSQMINEDWSEQDVREALRKSDEYGSADRRNASADRIIRRAYQEILKREPDAEGLQTYRRAILDDGWEEHDVRQALRRSTEKRQLRAATTDAQATEIVRRAYLSVLNREPDANGLRDYKARVMRDRWTEQQVVNALRDSPEYKARNR